MTSNDDLMSYLKKMEEKRLKEKEEDAEMRKKEKEIDREEMVKLMNSCVEQKMSEMVVPLKERTDKVEKVQLEMQGQMNRLMEQMKVVKEKLDEGPTQVESGIGQADRLQVIAGGAKQATSGASINPSEGASEHGKEIRDIISHSRRTIGLQKIDRHDVARMRQEQFGAAANDDEEKLFAVREYLELEIKIPKTTVEKMEIERIFTPVSAGDDYQWLYVTFRSEASVHKIYEKTRIMRKESRILNYIPREFHSRFEAIRDIGNSIRISEKCKTRIKMGYMDLQLHKKEGSQGRWELVPLPSHLPAVELGISPRKPCSGSPAPGRPGQVRVDKRVREHSEGSPSEKLPSKVSRSHEIEDKEEENPKVDDTGKVVEEESYCPASPAPLKTKPVFVYESPIFSKFKTGVATSRAAPLNN